MNVRKGPKVQQQHRQHRKTPVAAAPAPPGPTNVTKILEKLANSPLNPSSKIHTSSGSAIRSAQQLQQWMTMFAPTDNAFSSLKSGTLNSLSDEQKVELVQFHVPTYLISNQFQTISNPLRTQAGDSGDGKFPLNITTSGNSVNITSGLTNTSVSGTIYTDGLQLLPAPVKSKKKKASVVADSPTKLRLITKAAAVQT
ncbi:Fasciclin-like arabinogalactan protein 11 [Hibiscus syriacus]|uniref:Fasciclin-like arabinogalactan protein 11 n=1 Tax=Hibiscus syriacus TaxID=106335 RepID=A0A6A3D865_HIBSY|nr:Fasciclin-like arabinogalactan protein 11 [Hibiscus syriacus]